MIWWLLLGIALVAAPFVAERLKPALTNDDRAAAPGDLARLPNGMTHFQWHGPEYGPVLVCIHGLTTPSPVWERLIPGLTRLGFRVLTYDLYGRGLSDRPDDAQGRAFFIDQLSALLDDQGVTQPITLCGYSMGGSIATIFAAAHPARVSGVVLLASAGMEHRPSTLARLAQHSKILGRWLFLACGGYTLVDGVRRQKGAPDLVGRFAKLQKAEVARGGYLPAVLSSQRHLLAETLKAEHRDLAAKNIPVFAIWGAADTVIPLVSRDILAEWNPKALQAEVNGAGHSIAFTHPEAVIAVLKTFMP